MSVASRIFSALSSCPPPKSDPSLVRIAACLLFATCLSLSCGAQEQKPFGVQAKWKVGGPGGWDYLTVDSKAHRLYITHDTRVEIINSTNGRPLGAVTGLKGVHGVALDDDGKFGYISDGAANAVVVFDRVTMKVVDTIPAGTQPDAIVFEPVTRTVWAFNGGTNNATVIDASTRKVTATVPLPGRPEFAVADGTGLVFNAIESKNELVRIDARKPGITATWPLTPCRSPSGLAIDRQGRRLFAVCDARKMAVVDANTGKVVATPLIGDGPDAAAYDEKDDLVFSSNGEGTLTIIDAADSKYKLQQSVRTQPGARTMALDPVSGVIYLVSARFGPRPAATADNPHPWPTILPDTMTISVVSRDKFIAGAWPSIDIQ